MKNKRLNNKAFFFFSFFFSFFQKNYKDFSFGFVFLFLNRGVKVEKMNC